MRRGGAQREPESSMKLREQQRLIDSVVEDIPRLHRLAVKPAHFLKQREPVSDLAVAFIQALSRLLFVRRTALLLELALQSIEIAVKQNHHNMRQRDGHPVGDGI